MDLEILSDRSQWLEEEEFLSKYQVTSDQLELITNLIDKASLFI